jgi:hypothetical protein
MTHRIVSALGLASAFLLFASCASLKNQDVVSDFDKAGHLRVALLVCRMGVSEGAGDPMSDIALDTDYSLRQGTGQRLYIDDEARIKETLPNYPKCVLPPSANLGKARKEELSYFKSISPQLDAGVSALLGEKGYKVVDLRAQSSSWEKPFTEMKVQDIIESLKGKADALLIVQYRDYGYHYLYAINVETESTGFSNLDYCATMFDIGTKRRLLFLKQYWTPNISRTISHDDTIVNKPAAEGAKPTQIFVSGGRITNANIETDYQIFAPVYLSEDEIVKSVVRYVCYGNVFYDDALSYVGEWVGLNSVLP